MRILHLTLHRKWFDLIASGKKDIEYREASPYWMARIFEKFGAMKKFDEIHFRNGYGKERPLMVTKFVWAFVSHAALCDPKNGEELNGQTINIKVGERLRFENYEAPHTRQCGGCRTLIASNKSLCSKCNEQLHNILAAWTDNVNDGV